MRKIGQKLLLAASVGFLFSCSPTLKVSSDYDRSIDFTRYKTWSLYPPEKSLTISSLNQDRIIKGVKSEMAKKGYQESSSPDLLVNTVAIVKNKTDVTASTDYYGYGGLYRPYYWGTGMSSSYTSYSVDHYKVGSLIIDILDAKTQKLLWQGIGNSKLDQSHTDADTRIPEAIGKIMEGFPPGTSKK